ncbi:hypothetical protein AEB_P0910 [Altererythrobacter sp. B11]|nr:hypothetical protein AEB_P0910 [Altererythrobacter sp. B11]
MSGPAARVLRQAQDERGWEALDALPRLSRAGGNPATTPPDGASGFVDKKRDARAALPL